MYQEESSPNLSNTSFEAAVAQIAEDTGVGKEAVAAVLKRIGLTKSLEEALQVSAPTKIQGITADSIVAGVKIAQTLVHK